MSGTVITKSVETDFGGLVNTSQLQELILESGITDIGNRLIGINVNGDVLDIMFTDTLSGGEITVIENIIANYVYEPPLPGPDTVPIYVYGALNPTLAEAVVTGTSSGGNVVFSALGNYDDPIFEDIITSSAVLNCFSTNQSYIYGVPVLAGNKETITVPVRVLSTTTVTILGISVLSGTTYSNPANGTTFHLRIYGHPIA